MPLLDLPFALKSTDVFGLNDQAISLIPSGLGFQPVTTPQVYKEPTPIQLAGTGILFAYIVGS